MAFFNPRPVNGGPGTTERLPLLWNGLNPRCHTPCRREGASSTSAGRREGLLHRRSRPSGGRRPYRSLARSSRSIQRSVLCLPTFRYALGTGTSLQAYAGLSRSIIVPCGPPLYRGASDGAPPSSSVLRRQPEYEDPFHCRRRCCATWLPLGRER